jgi:hypothetical protein
MQGILLVAITGDIRGPKTVGTVVDPALEK